MRKFLCGLACLLGMVTLQGCGANSTNGNISLTPAEQVAAAKAVLAIGYAAGDSASSVTQNLTLPSTGLYNVTITWASQNAAVVTNSGQVIRPLTRNAAVTLTATFTAGMASDTRDFPITVLAQMTDAQAVAAAKAALAIGYQPGDGPSTVTQQLTLLSVGLEGCTVTWSSSDPAIGLDGSITRPSREIFQSLSRRPSRPTASATPRRSS